MFHLSCPSARAMGWVAAICSTIVSISAAVAAASICSRKRLALTPSCSMSRLVSSLTTVRAPGADIAPCFGETKAGETILDPLPDRQAAAAGDALGEVGRAINCQRQAQKSCEAHRVAPNDKRGGDRADPGLASNSLPQPLDDRGPIAVLEKAGKICGPTLPRVNLGQSLRRYISVHLGQTAQVSTLCRLTDST